MDLFSVDEGDELAYEMCSGAWCVHADHRRTDQLIEVFGVISLDRVSKMFELRWQQPWERKL